MTATRRAVAARVARLADTLADLKRRVRAAVATETGKAVADAVRDVLTAMLGGTLPSPYTPYRPYRPAWDRDDDEDDDDPAVPGRWDEDDEDRDDTGRPHTRPTEPAGRSSRWAAFLAVAAAAVRGWADRRLPGWAAAAVGVLAAVASAVGGPVADAGLAVATAAADLLPHSLSTT